MPKEEVIVLQGTVVEAIGAAEFRVQVAGGRLVVAGIAASLPGELRIIPGDRVTVELSPDDAARGQITYRA